MKLSTRTISKGKIALISVACLVAIVLITIISINLIRENQEQAEYQRSQTPSLSEREVCAMLQNYLQSEINRMNKLYRVYMQGVLNEAATSFHASYAGKGQWSVYGLGAKYDNEKKGTLYYHNGGGWYIYERSGIIEPNNPMAKYLLQLFKQEQVEQQITGLHPYDWTERVRRVWWGGVPRSSVMNSSSSKSFGEQ